MKKKNRKHPFFLAFTPGSDSGSRGIGHGVIKSANYLPNRTKLRHEERGKNGRKTLLWTTTQ